MSKEREERYPTEEQLKQWMDGLVPLTSNKEKVTESYNKAIDDAIAVVQLEGLSSKDGFIVLKIISKLKSLKK